MRLTLRQGSPKEIWSLSTRLVTEPPERSADTLTHCIKFQSRNPCGKIQIECVISIFRHSVDDLYTYC